MSHYLVNESHPRVGEKEISGGIERHSLRCKEGSKCMMQVYAPVRGLGVEGTVWIAPCGELKAYERREMKGRRCPLKAREPSDLPVTGEKTH